ncbi:tRNA (adenine-N(1))-methyltransferase [Paenibacillus sp. CAA11]|uniref:tRNA (adenine(22)-N(1))-methyltransferase n=1 Tax=Paenibacillus sp. CAA11 TaxID=1532905 RepID=UPI000D35BAD8|nr:class I SAM-dependent methyltransferase [Paenibacillus sp. CAA11]AWB45395.1 tRNA (adenine-N(1))-methyltransferase [Paenibacillus sp. CAA11]
MKLSVRLQEIENRLPEGCTFADIGSDHALLPVSAVLCGRAKSAVAGEVNDGPYESAKRQVAGAGLEGKVDVRKGDGLAVIAPGEVEAITIAGMGGALMAQILESGLSKLEGVKRLILQPNVGEEIVRRWLLEHDWYLTDEHILKEDGKIYEILTAERHNEAVKANQNLYHERTLSSGLVLTKEWLLLMGPYLLNKPGAVFHEKWESEGDKLKRIRKQMAQSEQDTARQKEAELTLQIDQLKEVLSCLPKDKQ